MEYKKPKVKELIEMLEEYDGNMPVFLDSSAPLPPYERRPVTGMIERNIRPVHWKGRDYFEFSGKKGAGNTAFKALFIV